MVSLKYTAIISDLHLTDAEPSRPRYKVRHPLWKKFKTKEFFIDRNLCDFFDYIIQKANGGHVELVLNGDIFDFDSVMAMPEKPVYRFHWIETRRGLLPKEERSVFKMSVILEEHAEFIEGLRSFIEKGHSVVIIPGNHDVELHFPKVQKLFLDTLRLNSMDLKRVKFVKWFYISENDTLIEHGHQQDPYCLCENPLNPFLVDYNELQIRLPFGNVACRYIMNGMGLFNPHVEKNYVMSLSGYLKFFFKYLVTTQPLIIWTWFWGSVSTLVHVTLEHFRESYKPLAKMEDIVEQTAKDSQTTPKVVRELQQLFATPVKQNPWLIAKELWLDRAFMILAGLIFAVVLAAQLKNLLGLSPYWIVVPVLVLIPFFLFYARSITSLVSTYKEPDEVLFSQQAEATGVYRIVYGHTHIPRHEFYGSVEHLNSGTWSPGFTNVECTESIERNHYVWIYPSPENPEVRRAELGQFTKNTEKGTAV
ncbi:MAG: metallophosphoesterase [Pseudobdellovibrio sp.]